MHITKSASKIQEKMKLRSILAIAIVLCFLFFKAFSKEITIDTKENFTAYPGETIVIPVTLKNNKNYIKQILISVCSKHISWATISSYFFTLEPYSERTAFIYIEIPKDAEAGEYAFAIIAFQKDTQIERVQKIFKVIIPKNETPTMLNVSYPKVEPKVEILSFELEKRDVLPGEAVFLSLSLKNVGNASTSVKIVAKTEYLCYGEKISKLKNYTITLAEGGYRSLRLALPVENCCDAGNYSGEVEVFYKLNNRWEALKKIDFEYSVKVVGHATSLVSVKKKFPISEEVVTIINQKNKNTTFTYRKDLGKSYYLHRFDPKPSKIVKENGKYICIWIFNLSRGESSKIIIKSYMPLVLTLLAAFSVVASMLLLYLKKCKIVEVSKDAKFVGREKDARIVKIWVCIKNCGKETVRKVRLIEKLPKQVELVREFELLYPDISRENDSTILTWKVGNLRKGEERILSYIIKIKQSVSLPSAKVKFRFKAEDKEELSNKLRIVLRG